MSALSQTFLDHLAAVASDLDEKTGFWADDAGYVHPPAAGDGRKHSLSLPFPDAQYSFCGSTHAGAAGLLAFQTVLTVAKGVWSLADRGCDQVLVALGEGGNTSIVCIVVDTVLTAAQAVFDGYIFCENVVQ